ncbi:DUF3422 family protein [Pacificibacter marinus]|uniref:DUF3422 domain-containing protein n=1 Tax=Pacificibacter marinus TaxID=658057 RepID=A0A1Y5SU34_9RHOB|nr:DUF3422 domain-containing protein [Pacificibacter marinus]SEK69873.1 Uncharacterized membrane-anchored protein [Pacificibacter marinus]SLN45190.1 hypothetical protein PAM7971_02178 [Pacificibacter marinus]
MAPLIDHPRRYELANELHARPFPRLTSPASAAYLAIRAAGDAARRDRDLDRAHLIALLDRFGAPHPAPNATHYMGDIGKYHLKWESHTEFVTYTLFTEGISEAHFDDGSFDLFPPDWLDTAPGQRMSSALLRIEPLQSDSWANTCLDDWFERESLAVAHVLDGQMVVASDFRIDTDGHIRFAMFTRPNCGAQRIGRVLQRLCEIETYKTMSMLGLVQARRATRDMADMELELVSLMDDMALKDTGSADAMLGDILSLSTRIERLVAQTNFRFGATGAYAALVEQRINVLYEERFMGRQMFSEFMMRRFDPAMRTVSAAKRQLESLADRAERAANLLRTKVDVDRQAQNQALLASMDRRADLQLQLQQTVEGLSVVAISYYAVSLAGYAVYPLLKPLGISKGLALAGLTPLVVGFVWCALRRLKAAHHAKGALSQSRQPR